MLNEENINFFKNAGLTSMQARVFISLIELGQASIQKISEISNIERSNANKTMKDLEELELVKKQIGPPATYYPIPLSIAMSIMINRKKIEFNKMLYGLEKFAKNSDVFIQHKNNEKKDFFELYPPGSEVFCRLWEKTLKTVKNSVDIIVTEQREPKDDPIWEIYDTLLKKGVQVRWLLDRSIGDDDEFSMRVQQFQHLLKYPNIKMKICSNCLEPYGAICDNELAIILLTSQPPVKCARSLWTNNKQLLITFKEHFEINWNKATCHPVIST